MGCCGSKNKYSRKEPMPSPTVHGINYIPSRLRRSKKRQTKDNLDRVKTFNDSVSSASFTKENRWLDFTQYPFENLVMSGGGSKGYAYIGSIQALADCGVLDKIKRVAGSSVGAICGTLVAVGCSAQEVADLFAGDDHYVQWMFHDQTCHCVCGFPKIWRSFGVHAADRFYSIFGDYVTRKVGTPDITFKQLYEDYGRELCIVVTNLSRMCAEYLTWKTTPDLPIRDAVRMSMAFPLLYEPVRYNVSGRGYCLYSDGGTLDQYPIHCFDESELELNHNIVQKKNRKVQAYNEQTIGLYVVSETTIDYKIWQGLFNKDIPCKPTYLPETKLAKERMKEEFRRRKRQDNNYTWDQLQADLYDSDNGEWLHWDTWNKEQVDIKSLGDYVITTIETLLVGQRKLHITPSDVSRTVAINCGYIGTNDYILEPEDKAFLIRQGYEHTKRFLQKHIKDRAINSCTGEVDSQGESGNDKPSPPLDITIASHDESGSGLGNGAPSPGDKPPTSPPIEIRVASLRDKPTPSPPIEIASHCDKPPPSPPIEIRVASLRDKPTPSPPIEVASHCDKPPPSPPIEIQVASLRDKPPTSPPIEIHGASNSQCSPQMSTIVTSNNTSNTHIQHLTSTNSAPIMNGDVVTVKNAIRPVTFSKNSMTNNAAMNGDVVTMQNAKRLVTFGKGVIADNTYEDVVFSLGEKPDDNVPLLSGRDSYSSPVTSDNDRKIRGSSVVSEEEVARFFVVPSDSDDETNVNSNGVQVTKIADHVNETSQSVPSKNIDMRLGEHGDTLSQSCSSKLLGDSLDGDVNIPSETVAAKPKNQTADNTMSPPGQIETEPTAEHMVYHSHSDYNCTPSQAADDPESNESNDNVPLLNRDSRRPRSWTAAPTSSDCSTLHDMDIADIVRLLKGSSCEGSEDLWCRRVLPKPPVFEPIRRKPTASSVQILS